MSQKLIPNPKDPVQSTDYIYGERMGPYEDRMNFFLNEKVDVKKDNVKEEDKATVDGLEGVIQRFVSYGVIKLPNLEEEHAGLIVDGVEAAAKVKNIIQFLVQLAKDAVDFILNLINNRVARLDNREFKVSTNRKRNGLINTPVKYPATVRRLFDPLTISLDPNWVMGSLNNLNGFYGDTVKVYKDLTGLIKDAGQSGFNIDTQLDKTLDIVKKHLGLVNQGDSYISKILPGNRHLVIDKVTSDTLTKVGVYFHASTTVVKLRSPDYEPSGPMIDNTLISIRKTVKDIRSNQSTISQLYRDFEKAAKAFERDNVDMTSEQRTYLNWLVRFNKRLMTLNIQYVLNGLDAGLDFVNTGIQK